MGPQQSGYSWASTSQWSQLPTVPADTSNSPAQAPTNNPSNTQYGSSNSYATGNTYPPASSTPPETRRDMITRLYQRILGREPDQAGLNYYLFNSQISETQIAREMYESTEHQEYLRQAKDVREMVKKLELNETKVRDMETKLSNAESLAKNYKLLVDQKTQIINDLRAQYPEAAIDSFQTAPQIQSEQAPQNPPHIQPYDQYEEGVILNDPFAEDYENRGQGCLGTIKRWLKF